MAIPPIAPAPAGTGRVNIFGKAKLTSLIVLANLVFLCLALSWNAGSTKANLSLFSAKNGTHATFGKKTLVDVSPWQTAQTLAALAVTAEENEYARDAERLGDHDVDQAFAAALRESSLQSEHAKLTGEALAISQRISQLQQLVAQDQAQVQSLTPAPAGSKSPPKGTAASESETSADLEVAKAQLGLDTDELADAQRDLARAAGDDSATIQEELTAHEAAMHQSDAASQQTSQVAAIAVSQNGTVATRVSRWFSQIDRYKLIQQAQQQAQQQATSLTAQHDTLEAQVNADSSSTALQDRASRLANIKDRSAQRQILSIFDDRIQTEQQLATVYSKWAAQVMIQHGIVGRLILQSFSVIILILICMLLCDTLVRQLMSHHVLDKRQTQTLRSVLELAIQVFGVLLILLVIFGTPRETPTILGLATAALTIALQDFIIAFLGWFVLVSKNGIHVGDWVEINGVGGEVTEVGLFSTSLLETGTLEDKGHPTGRRITFMNGFAIRGQYFNFSSAGQWMWDEIGVTIPSSAGTSATVEQIHQIVVQETKENTRLAEMEWKRGTHDESLRRFSADPVVNLRPSSAGVDTRVRYVTRASDRFELRNRLYERIVQLLQSEGKRVSVPSTAAQS
ncbi:MAG TPA: mechanosensitive ion channel domain-containing protein [Terracidiphilus sp.]|jgi:small-conductance mechanosensitive channel|nr:mechanosensitive ion channel domain-containing protein [Terracidiphilus sp.]